MSESNSSRIFEPYPDYSLRHPGCLRCAEPPAVYDGSLHPHATNDPKKPVFQFRLG